MKVRGKPVSLPSKEFDLLATLISKAGRVLGVAYLPVWDSALAVAEAERARKLGLCGALIPSIPGIVSPTACTAACRFPPPSDGMPCSAASSIPRRAGKLA